MNPESSRSNSSNKKRTVQGAAGGFLRAISEILPGLPLLAFGTWFAWSSIAYNGSTWLSVEESDGEFMVLMFIISTASFTVTCFFIPFLCKLFKFDASSSLVSVTAGLVASFGAFLVVAAGPHFLNSHATFNVGCVLTGIGTAFVAARIMCNYSRVSLSQMFLYAGLSQLVVMLICSCLAISPRREIVEGAPDLASVIVFVALPIITALMAVCPSRLFNAKDKGCAPKAKEKIVFSVDFVSFLLLVFVISVVTGFLRSMVVASDNLVNTQSTESIIMLLRFPVCIAAFILSFCSLKAGEAIGRIYSFILVVMVFAVACVAIFQSNASLISIVSNSTYSLFVIIVWGLAAYSAQRKGTDPADMFCIVYGIHMAACTIGWLVGAYILPFLSDTALSALYLACAAIVLILSFLVFPERSLSRLFTPILESELYVKGVGASGADGESSAVEGEGEGALGMWPAGQRGWFTSAIESLAEQYCLTTRESDIFRLLAMGYSSDYIAEELTLSVNTVRTHTHNLYVKLDVHSRDELIAMVGALRKKAW